MTSSMLDRVIRMITAMGIVARARAGIMRCSSPSQKPAKFRVSSESTSTNPVMAVIPVVGSRRPGNGRSSRLTPKITTRIMASQKMGMLIPVSARPQVAPESILEEEPVLDEDRLVETHVLPDLLDLLLGGLLAEHDLGRISGERPHHEEHDYRHPEQHRDDLQDSASCVLRQSLDLRPDSENSHRHSASTARLRF